MKLRDIVNAYKKLLKNRGYKEINIVENKISIDENKISNTFLVYVIDPSIGNIQLIWCLTEKEIRSIVEKNKEKIWNTMK